MARPFGFPLLLLAAAGPAWAQAPAGPEFRVNTFTISSQTPVSAAPLAGGGFVVVMNSPQDGSQGASVAQRFGPSGARLGAEFVVNAYTTANQISAFSAAVAGDGRGRFVVGWTSTDQDGSGFGVFARRFAASGAAAGAELRVNTYTTGSQSGPQVATAADGSFVVVWAGYGTGGGSFDVFGQRFDPAGTPRGTDFLVNTYTTGFQSNARVHGDASGRFLVVWLGADGNNSGVLAQRYDAAGARIGGEFVVNTTTAGLQRSYGGAMNGRGELVVVWRGPDGGGDGVFARRFDSALDPVGAEFLVNTITTGSQDFGTAAMDEQGNFVVAWVADTPGDGGSGTFGTLAAFGQRFSAAGARRGAEFRANTYTTGDQDTPVVTSDDVGNFVVAWESGFASGSQDGSSSGAFAQRYGGLRPAAMSVTDGANGVLEVPEDFALVTSWRNFSGAPQAFQGVSSAAMVPAGLFLTLGPTANYGTVPDGAVGACAGPCFSGALTGTRPSGHLDLGFLESIQPDAQGQQKRWRVHVGDSFTDVPRTNPFYRFIETLLHHSVTGGCGANAYCPAGSTTREQMSVFVLVAREGSGYVPPACAVPVFSDVPAASPFCRWIEELARRGVAGGCGGGNFCPGDAVTREQMAVFVLRTLDETLSPPACTTPVFDDVPADSPFCRWIEELARRGVVSGCGGGSYCPTQPVTREQMGVFISLTFGLALYGP
jgi:hypothetical protein